jgi:hypothetical protein
MDQPRALETAIDDLATARALIASLQEQLTTSQREIAALRHELDILCQRLFGKKSERVDPRQLKLALEQLANERGPVETARPKIRLPTLPRRRRRSARATTGRREIARRRGLARPCGRVEVRRPSAAAPARGHLCARGDRSLAEHVVWLGSGRGDGTHADW